VKTAGAAGNAGKLTRFFARDGQTNSKKALGWGGMNHVREFSTKVINSNDKKSTSNL
jgi:hypothetical protein